MECSFSHRIPAVSYIVPLCAGWQLECRDRELTSKRSNVRLLSRQQADAIKATEETERCSTDIQDSIRKADEEARLRLQQSFWLLQCVRKLGCIPTRDQRCRLAHSALSPLSCCCWLRHAFALHLQARTCEVSLARLQSRIKAAQAAARKAKQVEQCRSQELESFTKHQEQLR